MTIVYQIADFGFAAMERPHMLCNSIVGTHAYTAPEVLGGATVYLGHQVSHTSTIEMAVRWAGQGCKKFSGVSIR